MFQVNNFWWNSHEVMCCGPFGSRMYYVFVPLLGVAHVIGTLFGEFVETETKNEATHFLGLPYPTYPKACRE